MITIPPGVNMNARIMALYQSGFKTSGAYRNVSKGWPDGATEDLGLKITEF